MAVLVALSFLHLLDDAMPTLIRSIYPMIKDSVHLSFSRIGLITLTFPMTITVL